MHEKAIETFQKLSEKQGVADITVDKAIEKSTVAMANEQLREMEDSGASEEELAEARKSILQYQIDCAKQRIANFPNDLILRYELGTLYFDADMFAEALPEFEESAKNPQRKEIALTYVGRCCAALKQFDRAVQIFKELLEDMSFMNIQKRRTLYYLGVTFEQMNDSASAYDCFKQIYDSNAKYMDVAEKVKKYAPETTAEA